MINISISGGLGDTIISYAKLFSDKCPFSVQDNLSITRLSLNTLLNDATETFWKLQGFKITNETFYNLDEMISALSSKRFDYEITGDIHGCIEEGKLANWPIAPFPPINSTESNKLYDIVISPVAGREAKVIGAAVGGSNKRIIPFKQLVKFIENTDREITLIGWADYLYELELSSLKVKYNFINKTTLLEAISILQNSNVNIVHDGFMSFLSGMLKKKTLVNTNNDTHRERLYHPYWNINYFKDLREIINEF